ncbi:MAG: hypothetical protein JRE58_01785 [Deltaproteobacteria bacterium]|nr:hypothetical protein [Deltaproteobacteria bacterium]
MNKSIFTQIYEIQTPREAEAMIELGVDRIGSVVTGRNSWKIPQIRETVDLVASTKAKSSLIMLFRNQDDICRALDYYRPDIVHFCDDLVHCEIQGVACEIFKILQQSIRQRFPEIKIMRSIPIGQKNMSKKIPTLELARDFERISDFFLTDTLLFDEKDSTAAEQPETAYIGVTGQTCDWEMAADLVEKSTIPVILAGGITPGNAHNALKETLPAGIDSCTGTNAVDPGGNPIRFKKDTDKVRRFIQEVQRAGQDLKTA